MVFLDAQSVQIAESENRENAQNQGNMTEQEAMPVWFLGVFRQRLMVLMLSTKICMAAATHTWAKGAFRCSKVKNAVPRATREVRPRF